MYFYTLNLKKKKKVGRVGLIFFLIKRWIILFYLFISQNRGTFFWIEHVDIFEIYLFSILCDEYYVQ